MGDKWSRCSLRITSEERSAENISEVLDAEPSFAASRGTPISRRAPETGLRTQSTWVRESGLGTTESLEKHIESILDFVEAHSIGLQRLANDCALEVFCGFSSGSGQGGFVVEHKVLRRLGEAGIDLVLDLFPPEREG